jgi:flagellar basal body rod protein FlgG
MGTIEQTGRSLDVALQGDGFFVVEGPRGPLYTRNGRFHVNDAGELVTIDGLKLQGSGGEVRLRPGTSTESLQITAEGELISEGSSIARLELVRFAEPTELQRAGKSLFSAPDGVIPERSEATVAQGMLEGSNVSAVSELIELIAASRQYEAASQAMRSITQATQQNIHGRGGN